MEGKIPSTLGTHKSVTVSIQHRNSRNAYLRRPYLYVPLEIHRDVVQL